MKIKVGTDCSGIEAPIEALIQLGVEFEHVFSSEIDKFAIQSIKANYNPGILYGDIMKRDVRDVPYVDLYVAGFPCQPFSSVGKKLGFKDTRGSVFFACTEYIRTKRPKMFILENVKHILHLDKGVVWKTILNELSKIGGYTIEWRLLNTCDYGIPQNRPRVYIIGRLEGRICWPIKVECKNIHDFIYKEDKVAENSNTWSKHKHNVPADAVFVNVNFIFKKSYKQSNKICPALLAKSRIWNCINHRHANVKECLMLQGFQTSFKQVVSKNQMLKQIGNSMSVNVIKELIAHNLLYD